jgi:hypothetical protein
MIDSPLIKGIADGLALMVRVAPSGETNGTSPPHPGDRRADPSSPETMTPAELERPEPQKARNERVAGSRGMSWMDPEPRL